jgi:hypothetical protein
MRLFPQFSIEELIYFILDDAISKMEVHEEFESFRDVLVSGLAITK